MGRTALPNMANAAKFSSVLPEDRNGFALRQSVKFAPSGKYFDRGVDLAFSEIGGKGFAGFHFWFLRQLLEVFTFLLRIRIHSLRCGSGP
jgi:hypothetical protein